MSYVETNRGGFCSCLFPMEPFKCCGAYCCCPQTWQKIQDFTHLSLVIGVLAGFGLIARSILSIYGQICWAESELYCSREFVSVVFCLTVITYISSIVGQYDEKLISRENHVREQKQKLLASYGDLLNDMDTLLTNATESASGLAERSFESKRRDFQRFLERAKQRFSAVEAKDGEMLTQFRKFCLNWLLVFQECSIDPVNHPLEVVRQEELMGCLSINEVADKCLERLRVTEVKFISHQQETDKKAISNRKEQLNVLGHKQPSPTKLLAITAGADVDTASAASSTSIVPQPDRITWIKCCSSGDGCGYHNYGTRGETYPRTCAFGCGKIVCLSRQHTLLLVAVLMVCIVLAVDVGKWDPDATGTNYGLQLANLVFLPIFLWTMVMLLLQFEELDTVQKLEREVLALQEQNDRVTEQSNKMKEFWNHAQNLTELWLYRTVPRLDLYKELHSQLEDEEEEDVLSRMKVANGALNDLEKKLGALECWRNDGDLKTEDKKMFGKTVNEICTNGNGELNYMLKALQDNVIHGQVMRPLKDLSRSKRTR